jgi:hypothetical protein
MSDFDTYDEADKLLGRFDFALEIAAKDDAHRAQMRALLGSGGRNGAQLVKHVSSDRATA